ncbi:MAG: hydrogenase formation protein HypD, partial [Gammaproteobacteria bacterium]|nr:hydrogenase formation protein HypD [Gammaproteobacteria bacterium]
TGYQSYKPIAERYRVPIVVTGFEPLDIVQGLYMCIAQLEADDAHVQNQYARAVRPEGNPAARSLIEDVFTIVPRHWRGLGVIDQSGLALSSRYEYFDAEQRFGRAEASGDQVGECMAGSVLRGLKRPVDCPAFAKHCTPSRPLGAPMVSSEGACAAYFQHRRQQAKHVSAPSTRSSCP